ncbi:late embryogenesis abundant protein 6-like [Neltuma alba]|uniref:late embryogenesis abundant protein 6-like n=1 Tax=Neltuma alba TaxID=207710 RepID=UPI0010A3D3BC|nr:late embryogenesis abundant protein 6-like [Prosopis alba]XP_028782466.1 late embryogenesis abundant protein 6-like [Prosopis alba]
MQSTKEKLSNMASAAKEHIDIYKAKIDEKAEKATARTEEEKVIAHERAKAKEAQAKMELHEAKGRHASEKLSAKQPHHLVGHHDPSLVGAHQHGMNQPGYGAAPAVPENSHPYAGNYHVNKHI